MQDYSLLGVRGNQMSYADEIRKQIERRQILIGRIEEANYWIDHYSQMKSDWAKDQLRKAKRLRNKDMKELKELG